MWALLQLEWRRLWVRPAAWVLAALAVVLMAWELLLMLGPFLAGQAQLLARGSQLGYTEFVVLPWLALFVFVTIVLAALMSMSALADDRRRGTLAQLFAAGLSPTRIVLGKYFAIVAYLALVLALIVAMALALAFAGTPDWGKLGATVLGLLLLSLAISAIGMACSAWTSHPALAAAATLVLTLALFLVNQAGLQSGLVDQVAHYLALPTHLQPLATGLVSSTDVVWFLIVGALALALAIHRVGRQRELG